jgi:hypothetical protein
LCELYRQQNVFNLVGIFFPHCYCLLLLLRVYDKIFKTIFFLTLN